MGVLLIAGSGVAQTVRRDFDMTNGPVHAIGVDGNTLYIGGDFSRVGPPTGCAASISKTTGKPIHYHHIRGEVFAVAADGAGGWFIGGDFSIVGDEKRSCLLHVLPDGTLSPMISNGTAEVFALAVSGTTLYLGGHFSDLLGQTRYHIGAINIPTETLLPWNPNVGHVYSNQVYSIAVQGDIVYAGGDFEWFGSQLRKNAVAIDATRGAILDWDPSANGPVRSVAVDGEVVYLGGSFTTVGGLPRIGVAATSRHGRTILDWNAESNGEVRSLLVGDSKLLVGGSFNLIGGQPRRGIAELDKTTALATSWDPRLGAGAGNPEIKALALDGSTLYVGGKFTSIGGEPRAHIGAVDVSTAAPTGWDPGAEDIVAALAVGDDVIYSGGVFRSMGGVRRSRLAAIDIPSGRVTEWDPGADDIVRALAVNGASVYAGGSFDTIGGLRRKGIAELDAATGRATAWNPSAEGASVRAIVVDGATIYLGGSFSQINVSPRAYLAAVDRTTGEATRWDAELDGAVRALALDGPTLYAGGDFLHAAGVPRPLLVALDVVTAVPTGWETNPAGPTNPQIYALGVGNAAVYAGGDYSEIGGQPRRNIAALDAQTGLATAWDAGVNTTIYSIALGEASVYYGGRFGFLARDDGPTSGIGWGLATEKWCCGFGTDYGLGTVYALGAKGRNAFVGGSYNRIGPIWRSGISMVENELSNTPTLLAMFHSEATESGIVLTWRFSMETTGAQTWIERADQPGGPWTRLDVEIHHVAEGWMATDDRAASGRELFYRIGRERAGKTEWFGPFSASAQPYPGEPALVQVAPNPASSEAHVDFVVAKIGPVRLDVSDIHGRLVARLIDAVERPGRYRATWNGEDQHGRVRPGIYFVTYQTGNARHTRRVVVAR